VSSLRDDLSLLRDGRFALLLAARTIAMLGSAFAPVALAFGILHLPGGNPRMLSIVLACESIPLVAFLLLGGVIADRLPRSLVMLGALLLGTLAFSALALLIGYHIHNLRLLGAAAALSGIAMALVWPAMTGIVPEVVPADRLQAGNALLAMGVNTARIVGVVASGAVVAAVGGAWALAGGAAMFAVAGVLASRLGGSGRETDGLGVHSMFTDLREGWREFVSHEWLWVVVAQWAFLVLCFNAAHGVLGPVLADAELGGPRGWAWVLAAESTGMLFGVAAAMRWRPARPILVAVVLTAFTVPLPWLGMGLGLPLSAIMALAFAMGFSFELFGIVWNTTMQREVPPEALSRVSSYDALGSLMFGPIGLLLAGPAATVLGPHEAMLWCGGALVVIGFASLLSRDVRTLTWHAPVVDEPAIPEPPEQLV